MAQKTLETPEAPKTLETPEEFAIRLQRINENMLRPSGLVSGASGEERLTYERSQAAQPPPEKPSLTWGERTRLGFTSGQKQLWKTLVQDYGAANVLDLPDGRLIFRTGPEQPFQTVDESELTFNDMADLIGEIPEVAGQFLAMGATSIPGAMARAAVGGGGGRALKQLIGRGLGVAGPETSGEAAAEIGVSGATAGISEGIGQLAVRTATRFVSSFFKKAPLHKSVTEEGRETIRFYEELRERTPKEQRLIEKRAVPFFGFRIDALKPLPSEVREGTMIRMGQNISEKSILGGNVMEALQTQRSKVVMRDITNEYAERLTAEIDPDKLGESFIDVLNSGYALAERAPVKIRNTILQTASLRHLTADISKMKAFAKKRETSSLAMAEFGDDIIGVIKSLKGKPKELEIPLAGLIELRKRLISLKKSFAHSATKNPALFVVNKLKGQADEAILKSLDAGAPDLAIAWTEHNIGFAINKDLYKNDYLKSILRRVDITVSPQGSPAELSNITESVFLKGGVARLRAVRTMINHSEALNAAELAKLQKLREGLASANPAIRKESINRFKEVFEALELGGDPWKAIAAATQFSKSEIKMFGRKFVKAPSEAEQKAQKVIDDELWERLKDFLIQDVFTGSKDKQGALVGSKLLNQLGDGGKYGPAILKEALGPKVYNRLSELGGVLYRQQTGTARGGIGTMFVLLAQPGAARGLLQGKIGNFLAIVGVPGIFSRFIASDQGFRMLTRSFKVLPGSPEAVALLANMNSVNQNLEQAIIDYYSGDLEERAVSVVAPERGEESSVQ
jgi:hypothetical protein